MQILEDRSTPGCTYFGITPKFDTGTDKAQWQIQRTTYDGSAIVILFANDGKYNNVWDDRVSLFPACPPNPQPLPGTVDTNIVNTPNIDIIDMALANTEYTYTLPTGTKRFILKNTDNAIVNVGILSGELIDVWPIEPGATYGESELGTPPTFYFRSGVASQKLVVFSWS